MNPQEPKPYDAVLGGQSSQPINAVVLGGIAGVKHRLAHSSEQVRIAALSEALKYGEEGWQLIFQIVKTETGKMQKIAYDLMWSKANDAVKSELIQYCLFKDYTEKLRKNVELDMVSIPGGTFWMGSPENEDSLEDERPQHQVTIPDFYMGRYQVTQVQTATPTTLIPATTVSVFGL